MLNVKDGLSIYQHKPGEPLIIIHFIKFNISCNPYDMTKYVKLKISLILSIISLNVDNPRHPSKPVILAYLIKTSIYLVNHANL